MKSIYYQNRELLLKMPLKFKENFKRFETRIVNDETEKYLRIIKSVSGLMVLLLIIMNKSTYFYLNKKSFFIFYKD